MDKKVSSTFSFLLQMSDLLRVLLAGTKTLSFMNSYLYRKLDVSNQASSGMQ